METFETLDAVEQDPQLDPVNVPLLIPNDMHSRRMQRVLAYQAEALSKREELASNLANVNSGLFRIALWLEESIERDIEQFPVPEERLQLIYKAIDTHLRVVRQIDRFAQVELRQAAARESEMKKKEK